LQVFLEKSVLLIPWIAISSVDGYLSA